jgi:electron transport complex protein RnfB
LDARESLIGGKSMDPALIKLALGGLALLGCIGLLFGIGLALAAHKFAVETNPKVEAVLEVLAGAN